MCKICDTGCNTCIGDGLNNCQSCENYTDLSGNIVTYFKHHSENICGLTCIDGYFGSYLSNECRACAEGCVSCELNSSYCFSCRRVNTIYYYLPLFQNTCL